MRLAAGTVSLNSWHLSNPTIFGPPVPYSSSTWSHVGNFALELMLSSSTLACSRIFNKRSWPAELVLLVLLLVLLLVILALALAPVLLGIVFVFASVIVTCRSDVSCSLDGSVTWWSLWLLLSGWFVSVVFRPPLVSLVVSFERSW